MNHRECLTLLQQRLSAPDVQRTAATALAVVLESYRTQRVDDCELEGDGDMLLFQWGTYDWRDGGESFELELTRQFMPTAQDATLTQLALTFIYRPTSALAMLGEGNRWCPSPSDLPELEAFIRAHPAFTLVRDLPPTRVILSQDEV